MKFLFKSEEHIQKFSIDKKDVYIDTVIGPNYYLAKVDILKLAEMIKAEELKTHKFEFVCKKCNPPCYRHVKFDCVNNANWQEVKEPETKSENIKVLNISESKKQNRLSKFVGKQAVKLRELENKLSTEMDETNEMLIMILENKRKINENDDNILGVHKRIGSIVKEQADINNSFTKKFERININDNDNRDGINHILKRLRDLEKEVKKLGFHVPDFGKSNKELAERIKDISERLRILEQKKKDKIPEKEGYYHFADRVVYVFETADNELQFTDFNTDDARNVDNCETSLWAKK